ncbi:hypothetical protein Pan3_11 [Pseudanabaena phage Pan3]|nr:hypothetical protein Pan3_11 [Pseudanabaena phage Pan3]
MTELEALRAKLAARDGQPGYALAVKRIKERIAELEAENAG